MNIQNIVLNFEDLEPVRVPFSIPGKLIGRPEDKVDFEIREANGDAATRWKNCVLRSTKLEDGKAVGVDGMADADPLLAVMCLFEVGSNGHGRTFKPVVFKDFQAWPSKVTKKVIETVKRISELDDETEEALEKRIESDTKKIKEMRDKAAKLKNEQSAGEGGSSSPTDSESTSTS